MSQVFKGRVIVGGNLKGEALVSRKGFNTLASFQKSIVTRSKKARCSDQDNKDIFGKEISRKILCLPQTIGSTTGGLVILTAARMGVEPAAMLFSKQIDSLAAAGIVMTDIWLNKKITCVDSLGDQFLDAVQMGQQVEITEDGQVRID
jgi:predicted aconitase with swiveling domain